MPRFLSALVLIALLAGWASAAPAPSDKVAVVASFYPLYEFARQVGGDRVLVRNLTPAGAEPHDYELTPRDVIAVSGARVLIYNGAGLEPWVQKLLPQISERVVKINASDGIQLMRLGSGEDRRQIDPHVWLDPVLAQRQVDNILAGLVQADPSGRAIYEANAAAFKAKLGALHDRVQRALAPCRKKVFITSHAAFGYFAARYGLTQFAISGVAPEAEPSAAKIREILRVVRQYDIHVIYYETLVSPRVAAAIAREVGARTAVLNPIEGLTDVEVRHGKDYLSVMDENIRSLTQGLDCPSGAGLPSRRLENNSQQEKSIVTQPLPKTRKTWQRGVILQAMDAAKCHITAEELHRRVRRGVRPIGLATVYRALETFVREGLIEPVHVGDGKVRYGLTAKHHDHLVCLNCGEWEPLNECLLPRTPRRLGGFKVTGHQLDVYGYCAQCQTVGA